MVAKANFANKKLSRQSKISQTINIVRIRINIIPPQKKLFAGFVCHWQKVQTKLNKTIFWRILLRLDNFDENCLPTPEGHKNKNIRTLSFQLREAERQRAIRVSDQHDKEAQHVRTADCAG